MRRGVVMGVALALVGLGGGASEGAAQVSWDGPMLVSPSTPAGWGVHLVDLDPGNSLGFLATYRGRPAPVGLGFRIGVVEGVSDDVAVVAGVDAGGQIRLADADENLGLMWFVGGGAGVDGDVRVSVPAGLSLGYSFDEPSVSFRPYVAPRVVLDAFLGDELGREDDLDLGFAVEVGLDLLFDPAFGIRAAGSFGDRDAVSIGAIFPAG